MHTEQASVGVLIRWWGMPSNAASIHIAQVLLKLVGRCQRCSCAVFPSLAATCSCSVQIAG